MSHVRKPGRIRHARWDPAIAERGWSRDPWHGASRLRGNARNHERVGDILTPRLG
jgi:hypothetical protein